MEKEEEEEEKEKEKENPWAFYALLPLSSESLFFSQRLFAPF